ncbi:WYL domain-containing protein [Streptomyces sp. NPDC047974]|uniref:WYL domain-containing protein n=1 Tax=Streptomyces sp. NPDC047974 TaxID=3154343 RepID=UPI0033E06DE9
MGPVCEAGARYLIARTGEKGPRTYRVGRVRRVSMLPGAFDHPEGFELAPYRRDASARCQAESTSDVMALRVSDQGLDRIDELLGPYDYAPASAERDPTGWTHVSVPTESVSDGTAKALRFGALAEVPPRRMSAAPSSGCRPRPSPGTGPRRLRRA